MTLLSEIGGGLPGQDTEERLKGVVKQLNEWSRRIASEKILEVVTTDSTTLPANSDAIYVSTIPHGLNFTPIIQAYTNGISLTNNGVELTDSANTPLPTHMSAVIDTGSNTIVFRSWIYCTVDETNVYFIRLNSTSSSSGPHPITYHLLRETAN